MTANQIRYQEHLERSRSNRKNEQLTERRDRVTAQHYFRSDNEGARSNLARELETNRHNLATEQLQAYQTQLQGSQRDKEIQLAQSRLAADIEHNSEVRREAERSNLANETERHRQNLAHESQLQSDLNQRYAAMVQSSADKAFPGLGLIPGIITSFAHMGSPQQLKRNGQMSNMAQRVVSVGG